MSERKDAKDIIKPHMEYCLLEQDPMLHMILSKILDVSGNVDATRSDLLFGPTRIL